MIPTRKSSSSSSRHSNGPPPKICRLLPSTYQPSKHTVVVGKGNIAKRAEGNLGLRRIIEPHIMEYTTTTNKNYKTSIVTAIARAVKDYTPDGIGFVKLHNGRWFECSEHGAHDIISARLRDCKPDEFKSSNKSKAAKRRDKRGMATALPNQDFDDAVAPSVVSATELETSISVTPYDFSFEPIPFDDSTDPIFNFGIPLESLLQSKEEISWSCHQAVEMSRYHQPRH
jgi:hypothetical protein